MWLSNCSWRGALGLFRQVSGLGFAVTTPLSRNTCFAPSPSSKSSHFSEHPPIPFSFIVFTPTLLSYLSYFFFPIPFLQPLDLFPMGPKYERVSAPEGHGLCVACAFNRC